MIDCFPLATSKRSLSCHSFFPPNSTAIRRTYCFYPPIKIHAYSFAVGKRSKENYFDIKSNGIHKFVTYM